jgi:hypothetical protein
MISHCPSSVRKEFEHELLKQYHANLTDVSISYEKCYEEYVVGAVSRWFWFLCYFGGSEMHPSVTQYFHNQVLDFMNDHNMTLE